MKTEFKAKFLQHVAKKKQEEGFTLIELLVVIIIIGILSAIALPSFLNQANKAKQSEAKQYLSSVNKGLQAYYAENSDFLDNNEQAVDITDLGLGIKTQTTNYQYKLTTVVDDINPGEVVAVSKAQPVNGDLRGYAGGLGLIQAGEGNTTTTILCEQKVAGTFGQFDADDPVIADDTIACNEGGGASEVTK